MENKYYTPTIEEFHVGFEYETNLKFIRDANEIDCMSGKHPYKHCADTEWEKRIADEYENIIEDWDHSFWRWDTISKYFRVKYLDKTDIESLGYKFKELDPQGVLWFYADKNEENDDFLIAYTPDRHYMTIGSFIAFEESYYFDGNIKNKSQLKQLLEMIGI